MAHDVNPPQPSVWQRIKEAWPVITFSIMAALAIGGGYLDIKMSQARAENTIANNNSTIEEIKDNLKHRASKFIADQEFSRIHGLIGKNSELIDRIKTRINGLDLNDERVKAKIELEVEKLRSEIKDAARDQQRTLDAQSSIMREILKELKETN